MRHLPPIPWHAVTPGTILMYSDGPRAVTVEPADHYHEVVVFAEGLPPVIMPALELVQPVELDETDVVAVLRAAGFTVEPLS